MHTAALVLFLAIMQTGRAQATADSRLWRYTRETCFGADYRAGLCPVDTVYLTQKQADDLSVSPITPVADGAETVKPQTQTLQWTVKATTCHDGDVGCYSVAEWLDVPAIQKKRQFRDFPEHVIECGMAESLDLRGLMEYCLKEFPYYSCADEDRILEHSVNGKVHTCRKVQMQGQSAVEK